MIGDVLGYLTDGSQWGGSNGIGVLFVQHVLLTLVSLLIALAVGLPVAIWLGHRGRGGVLAVNISNVGRAVPILALLSILSLTVVGAGTLGPFGRAGLATLITLSAFALPPIVTNAYAAMTGVDPDIVESARGMGMSEAQVLRQVELPIALPLIVSGVRLAVVQLWATATVAALVAGPGLGRIITHGYDSNHGYEVIAGSLIVAVVALLLEAGMATVQRVIDPVPAGAR